MTAQEGCWRVVGPPGEGGDRPLQSTQAPLLDPSWNGGGRGGGGVNTYFLVFPVSTARKTNPPGGLLEASSTPQPPLLDPDDLLAPLLRSILPRICILQITP